MDSAEYSVGLWIAAAVVPPAFNNSGVITKEFEMSGLRCTGCTNDGVDKEFEADSFCPADVAVSPVPSREEPPSAPSALNDDRNSGAGTRIQEGTAVEDFTRAGDGAREGGP